MGEVILVTGGAGYIGSHTVLALRERGYDVVVLDDLSEGHAAAIGDAPLERVDLRDGEATHRVFAGRRIDAVAHFAARCYVGESVREPAAYYRNNVLGTMNLLDAMVRHGVRRMVFSSTCATYGVPSRMPIDEAAPQAPVNPYGATKLACEGMLASYARAYGLQAVSLRYFNAAGADPEGRLGEDHRPETHLIPLVIGAALGTRAPVTVFGEDYETPDGTCVRDYVHVSDLAEAHVLALEAMRGGRDGAVAAYNLGNEQGTSVREVLAAVERVAGRRVPWRSGDRRPGDPPVLVASAARIARELGWRPRFRDIVSIVETAWRWHENHPEGYAN